MCWGEVFRLGSGFWAGSIFAAHGPELVEQGVGGLQGKPSTLDCDHAGQAIPRQLERCNSRRGLTHTASLHCLYNFA